MPRVVWKGAIVFGLVHIPVSLYPASSAKGLDLALLDKRDFAPVGYQRINKRTGKPVAPQDIVKGYQYEDDQYVVVSEEDMRQANVEATQTVDIQSFVEAAAVPPYFFDTPYYLEPGRRGEKGYALLRETLRKSGRVGLAKVVIRVRQHLAALLPFGDVLLLNTLRYADEIRPVGELKLPEGSLEKVGVTKRELEMAQRLVEDMSEDWAPEQYHDTYRADLLARIEAKVEKGQTHEVTEAEEGAPAPTRGEVVDLMAMLKRSLEVKRPASGRAAAEKPEENKKAPARAPRRKAEAGATHRHRA
jgi:DNA end-binding protein Ku